MAFKASDELPVDALRSAKFTAVELKRQLEGFNINLAASGADYEYLRGIYRVLVRADNFFNTVKSVRGIGDYAKDAEGDANYDIAVEFTAMQAAIAKAKGWMESKIPLSNRTLIPVADWGDNNTLVSDVFTAGQTDGLRTELTAVVATIS